MVIFTGETGPKVKVVDHIYITELVIGICSTISKNKDNVVDGI